MGPVRGSRRRLSYANVVSTLALFLALGGVSMAGVKYLANGDPAGGDLAGTYPNPSIAAGAVTSSKLAAGAVATSSFNSTATAPNAAKLDGHAVGDFSQEVAAGEITFSNPINLAPGACAAPLDVPIASRAVNTETDWPFARDEIEGGFQVTALEVFQSINGNVIRLSICNNLPVSADISTHPYRYLVIR